MSVFIVPSGHPFGDQHPGRQRGSSPFHGGNRFCGQSNVNNVGGFWGHPGQFSQHPHHHPRGVHPHGHPHHHHHRGHGHPHGHPFFSPFEQEFDEEDENVDQWTQFIRSRIHQQQQQQAIERERQERERERERERRRIQRQREQEYQQFLVQQQQELQRQRQRQRFAATRVVHEVVDNFASIFDNFAQAATEEIQNRRRQQWQAYQSQRHAAAQAQAQAAHDEAESQQQSESIQDQQKQQWEELASQGLATALQFAEWFGGSLQGDDDEEEEEEEKTEEKKQEDDVMQVDEKQQQQQESSSSSKQVEIQVEDVKEPIVNDSTLSDQDPPEEDIAAPSTPVQQKETKEDNLLFNYPLPIDISKRSSLKADDIQVTYDQPTRTIQIRGLWDNSLEDQEQSSSSSSTTTVGEGYTTKDDDDQSSSSRGRKRSRSPKRSRVSEVDEKTGEEIVIEDQEDGFVNLSSSTNIPPVVEKGKQPQGLAKVSVPQGANLANLRAELTDEGFKLYI